MKLSHFALSLIIITTALFSQDNSQYSQKSMELMGNLQTWYQEEKVKIFAEKMVSEEEQALIEEQVSAFFGSPAFVEAGASYITALFTEPEIEELQKSLNEGTLFLATNSSPTVRKLHRLLKKFDPLLYDYVSQRITQ